MKFLKVKRGSPVKGTFISIKPLEEKETQWGNKKFYPITIRVNGEDHTWEATELAAKSLKTSGAKQGEEVVIELLNKDNKNFYKVHLADDAMGQAVMENAPPQPSKDDLDKKITMGMCMNCASRIVAGCKTIEPTSLNENMGSISKLVVNLAKSLYKEYTKDTPEVIPPLKDEDAPPVKEEEPEPDLDELPF